MAFHPYPELIRALFNVNRFGPPAPVTAPSAWPGVDHKVSRLPPATAALFGLAFAPGARLKALALAADGQLVGSLCKRHAVTPKRGSDRLQAHGFRFCFTPLSAVLFTFPSRYSSTIGLPGVLSLGGWCRQIQTGFLRPRPTQESGSVGDRFTYGAVTLYGPPFQAGSATLASSFSPALLPRCRLDGTGLGSSPFARRYSGSHCCFPFLRLLRCFSSSGWPPT